MLDHTGASIGEQCSSCYREGVPTVVVFEISPSHVKIFHHRPNAHNHHQVLSHAVRRLCVGSRSKTQVRSRHHVQVQSPFSTAELHIFPLGLALDKYASSSQ